MPALKLRVGHLEKQIHSAVEQVYLGEIGIDASVPVGILRQIIRDVAGSDCGIGPSRSRQFLHPLKD